MSRKMKDSGVDWIGTIPAEWEIKRLKSVLIERNEKNAPIKTDFILSLTNDRGVIPYTEKGDVGNKSKEDLTGYKLAYPNDIVLNSMNVMIGSVGLSRYFGAVSPVYYMLYPRKTEDSVNYFNHIFQTKVFQESLKGYGNGILEIRMRIQMSKLNTVMLPYPSSKEQEKITNFLDENISKIDSIIELNKKSIEEYKQYKQSLISETVTKGINAKVKLKDSGIEYLGDIPENWTVKKLRYLGTLQNGISKSSEYFGQGYPFVSYGDVYKNIVLPQKVEGLVNSSISDRKSYSVKSGDVFFTRTSETIEEVGFASTCLETIENAVFAGFVIRFRPYSDELNPNFYKYYFRSQIHRKFFVKEMNLVTRASLSQELLKKLPVLVPSIHEQKEIANFLDAKCAHINQLINQKEQLINELETYKKSLLYECVTGKIDVRNYKSSLEVRS
ncbi:restriction endonuclease subunit S [Bacillus sp. ISL-39]|uniref:restriction endonuclease subunit S n=1 Tax=Bacillus sp. ISL-39 TaxID=2819124 RepID=UPI001BE712E6|nr:restriction endonuclease subunit S [Bacillus sp. ISL-39]MBT2636442.1 restriction endonuclease subunit S [Bacillus sp. ISL-39]